MIKIRVLAFTILFFLIFSFSVFAFDYYNDLKVVNKDEKILNDIFTTSKNFTNEGAVVGDIIGLVGEIRNEGVVDGDILLGSFTSNIKGLVKGDLRNISWTTNIEGNIRRNVTTFSKDLNVKKNSIIEGSITVYAKNIIVDGDVGSDIRGIADNIIINGTIRGDVDIIANNIKFGDKGIILGDLNYKNDKEIKFSKKHVRGNISNTTNYSYLDYKINKSVQNIDMFFEIIKGISLIILGILASIFMKNRICDITSIINKEKYKTIAYGLICMIGIVLFSILLAITIIGLPIGIIVIILFGIFSYIIKIPVGAYIGKVFFKDSGNILIETVFGLSIIILLTFMPYIGGILNLLFISIGFGSIYYKYKNKFNNN